MTAAFTTNDEGILTLVPARNTEPGATRVPWTSRPWVETGLLAVPLVLVNLFAAYGQSMWAWDHLTNGVPFILRIVIAAAFSVAVETVALVLSAIAHKARMAGDASLPARLGSYAVAAGAAAANYSHWSPAWWPNAAACTFAAFSFGSPWLWGIWSKSKHRAALRESGQIDPRSVRFSLARWILWFGPTFRAYRQAVWEGTSNPVTAIERWEADTTEPACSPLPTVTVTSVTEPARELAIPAPQTVVPGSLAGGVRDDATTPPQQPTRQLETSAIRAQVRAYREQHPDATQKSIADALNVSVKTVQRALAA